jgi:ABC-2 type transport system permease protein
MFNQTSLSICKHELRLKLKNNSIWLLFALMQVLLAIALWTSWQQYQHSQHIQSTSQTMVEKQWNAQPDRHPHRVAHFGHFAFRPPSVLSYFDVGVNNWVGHSVFLEAHKQNSANFANDSHGSTLLRFSELSIANILLLIWPLLLIVMAFACISGERQAGTLKQLMSMGVNFKYLIFGKGLAYWLLSLSFLLPIFFATIILALNTDLAFTADVITRLTVLFASYAFYCLFWVVLILLCSSLTTSPKVSLSALITLWFILTILTPRALAEVAQHLYPHKNSNELALAVKLDVRKVGNSHNPNDPHFNAFKSKILAEYDVTDVADLPLNYRGLVMQEGERITAEIYQRHREKQLHQFAAQQRFVSHFYWFNPYLAVRDLSMALSASDQRHFFDFEQQAEQHRYDRTQQLNQLHIHEVDLHNDRGQRVSSDFWKKFPAFHYEKPALTWSLQGMIFAAIAPLLSLLILVLLLTRKKLQRSAVAHA